MDNYKSQEFNHISSFFRKLNENGGTSYSRIRDLAITGALDYLFETNGIEKDFKTILDKLILVLNDSLEGLPYSRKFLANSYNDFTSVFSIYGYSFGAYLNKNILLFPENNKLFFRFPLFFKSACQKYNIEPYASMDEKQIKEKLSKYIDISCYDNPNSRADRDKPEYEEIPSLYLTLYHDKYDDYYNNNIKDIKDFSTMDDEEFTKYMSIAAEEDMYNNFCKINDKNIFWVAQYVDSFGCDILSFDNVNQKEKLVEVKSSFKYDYFDLTTTEYETMTQSIYSPNTQYYVSKYFYNRTSMLPEKVNHFIYDKNTQLLIDMNDPNYGCQINDYIDNKGKLKYRCNRCKVEDIHNDFSNTLRLRFKGK